VDSGPHAVHASLGYPSSQPKRHLDRISRRPAGDRIVSLYGADMSLRIARLPLADPNRNPCFLGVTRLNNPYGISISSVVFARLAVVSNRQNSLHTDHARYVATGRTVALRACHTAQERGRRICALLTGVDKKLSYRRGTAISPQQVVCIQVIYTSRPWSVCL